METKLEMMVRIGREMPVRTPMRVLGREIVSSRASRGRSDNDRRWIGSVGFVGSAQCGGGWGVISGAGKTCDSGGSDDWYVTQTYRPPVTEAERDQISRAMAERWDSMMADLMTAPLDDDRDLPQREADRRRYYEIVSDLRAAGLLRG